MSKRVAIYIRVSTEEQAREGYSLAAQRKSLESWVMERGYEIYQIYSDPGISAKDIAHRPSLIKMLSDAEAWRFDIILILALSRLTRKVSDFYYILEIANRNGIALISRTEPFDLASATGRAMMGILMVFAQMELEMTGERVRTAMAERAAQGKRTCSEALGYDKFGKDSFLINEAEAEQVRYIFDRYIEYQNLSAVAELCKLKGYRGKRGGILRAQHIKLILSHPIYIGYNLFGGQMYKGDFEPIISIAQWNEVQRILGSPSRTGRPRNHPN